MFYWHHSVCGCACLKVSVVELSAVKGVVDVCATGRVDTAHSQLSQVLSLHHLLNETLVQLRLTI